MPRPSKLGSTASGPSITKAAGPARTGPIRTEPTRKLPTQAVTPRSIRSAAPSRSR